ncbi:Beta-galactosidase [termite gut metagenome]|uniref:Beta-galactosidase n=1 Tax=termite gut metagenome TaxID=433724 RepID=A0A5J4R5R4_9ZZZZ
MKKLVLLFTALLISEVAFSQSEYTISISENPKAITHKLDRLGGVNPTGNTIDFNSYYMQMNNKPFIPIMGEVHYSRLPHTYWEEEILKMKSGGINVIATYVFWNIHEWKEGVFDWSGNKNLREFLLLCQKHNMFTLVRVGPFCHGEIRNGGLPDWIYGRAFEVRSNNEGYLFYVKRLYHNIAQQLQNLYYKDGGTLIGIQLENELQHSASPWAFAYAGNDSEYTAANYDAEITQIGVAAQDRASVYARLGVEHLATLKKIATQEGIIVPLYTVTGWGNAAVLEDEAIPVTAAYPYPFWAKPSRSNLFLFKNIQKNPDYKPVRYNGEKYPSFCAEMGAGIQITYPRRPRVPAEAAEALMLRSLGSGANGIGYYMYHGGLTPQQEGGVFLSDEPMAVPKISYDFQAPLGEYGKARDSYFSLRIIHLFAENFAEQLAPMGVILPQNVEDNKPENRETLRFAVRSNGKSGFIFMHNFQDHDERIDQAITGLNISLSDGSIRFPSFTLKRNNSVIFPFNMLMSNGLLKYATVQPLAVTRTNGKQHYFFYAHDGIMPEYVLDKNTVKKVYGKKIQRNGNIHIQAEIGLLGSFTMVDRDGNEVIITTLTRKQALGFNQWEKGYCITDAVLLQDKTKIQLQSRSNKMIIVLPSEAKPDWGKNKPVMKKQGIFTEYTIELPVVKVRFEEKEVSKQRYIFNMKKEEFTENLSDIILDIDYVGDTGAAFIDGKMINDNLYYGNHWQLGLKQYAGELDEKGMSFYFKPMRKDASYLIDFEKEKVPVFDNNTICKVENINVIPEYSIHFEMNP